MGNNFSINSIKINGKNYAKPLVEELNNFLGQFNNIEHKEISIDGNNGTTMLIQMNKNKTLCIFW
jgi:hypothetical protein